MFLTKSAKIRAWLRTANRSPFADLLEQEISGEMKCRLMELGLTKPEFQIDWLTDYKCIDIQARRGRLYVDIQIEPDSFTISADEIEPDDPTEYPLRSADGFYDTVRNFF